MSRSIYGDVHSRTALRAAFREIRRDIAAARTANALNELHHRAGYVVSLTREPTWQERFGEELDAIRALAVEEFSRSVRALNRRVERLGADVRYDERWSPEEHAHRAPQGGAA